MTGQGGYMRKLMRGAAVLDIATDRRMEGPKAKIRKGTRMNMNKVGCIGMGGGEGVNGVAIVGST